MQVQLDQICQAATENGWQQQSLTKITQTHYSNDAGNEIIYYLCHSAYVDETVADTPELNTAAFQSIVDPDTADVSKEYEINGMPAAVYEKADRAFLCWTASPELSFVLEYDPEATEEAEIIKMAESVDIAA